MSPVRRSRFRIVLLAGMFVLALAAGGPALSQSPPVAEVAELLRKEPLTLETWPQWRERLLAWMGDRTTNPDAAFEAARKFMLGQADMAAGELPPALSKDALAWYLLGRAYMASEQKGKAELALRRSLGLGLKLANPRVWLAFLLMNAEMEAQGPKGQPRPDAPRLQEARKLLDEAERLNPNYQGLPAMQGQLAASQSRLGDAEKYYRLSIKDLPEAAEALTEGLGACIAFNDSRSGHYAPALQPLVNEYPQNGRLACLHALALARDQEWRQSVKELERGRSLGVDPKQILSPQIVDDIESKATPGWIERVLLALVYFAGAYAVIMLLMIVVGWFLALRTRGSKALELLGVAPDEIVSDGQVARSTQETALAKYYALAILAGLVFFYLAIPFVVAGLVAVTAGALTLVFMAGRIPVKLVILIVVIGGGMVWAVLKSVFARPAKGGFGIPKTAEECPRIHQLLAEVAGKVDTSPVDEVFLAPGSSIGVHQEGRGPFGLFGVKSRVLTLGMSTMNYLTIGELKAILAHEYAHFSHSDTFYNRFIYQVSLSIGEALDGMGQAGGFLNYVNPFFWFLWLYHKAYHLLSAGFSRSREFLADRMACTLYGSDVFTSALTKVGTDGALFEMTMYQNIEEMLDQDKAFVNMYEAFRSFRDEHLKKEDRDELFQKLLDEKESLFASHPTFQERVEAASALPKARNPEPASALTLFEKPEEIEKELTEFMTGFMAHIRRLRAEAAAAAGH